MVVQQDVSPCFLYLRIFAACTLQCRLQAGMRKFWTVIGLFASATPVGIMLGVLLSTVANSDGAASVSALASGAAHRLGLSLGLGLNCLARASMCTESLCNFPWHLRIGTRGCCQPAWWALLAVAAVLNSLVWPAALTKALAAAAGTFLYVAFMEVIPRELANPSHRTLKLAMLMAGFGAMSLLAVWA